MPDRRSAARRTRYPTCPTRSPGPGDPRPYPPHRDDPPRKLVHLDVKKLGRIPTGGGWRVNGRVAERGRWHRTKVGYAFVYSAVDGYSRLAYSEVLADEEGATAAAFWRRAADFFAEHGITVERVLTDNGSCYRSRDSNVALGGTRHAARGTFSPGSTVRPPTARSNGSTKPCSPSGPTPGKWTSDGRRTRVLAR